MSENGYLGIDYGGGTTNVDLENGIRYGVISMNAVAGEALNDLEHDYPFNCPDCGSESLVKSRSQRFDFFCRACRTWHMSDECYGDESIGFHYDGDGYQLENCLDSDIMVIKSPYYTLAQFCSPCVPGAGNLDNPISNGVKTYCLGPDWFDEYRSLPYPVYRVEDESLVEAA